MFKLMRACIEVKAPEELIFYNEQRDNVHSDVGHLYVHQYSQPGQPADEEEASPKDGDPEKKDGPTIEGEGLEGKEPAGE